MLNNEQIIELKAFVEFLEDLANIDFVPEEHAELGICSTCIGASIAIYKGYYLFSSEYRGNCYADWPSYSGNVTYPVPSPNPKYDAETSYGICSNKWVGEYGSKRKELAKHIADWVETNLLNKETSKEF